MKLIPFSGPVDPAPEVTVARAAGLLHLRYELPGVGWPPPPASVGPGTRRDRIWEGNCMELFIDAGAEAYWEYNFSPDGSWNCYQFDGYRRGMRPAPGALHNFERSNDFPVTFTIRVDAPPGLAAGKGRCNPAVILHTPDGVRHFAARHIGERPDFHAAGCRVLPIP